MKIERFRGLDNIHTGDAQHTLKPGDLIEASDVDVRNDGTLASREGFAQASAGTWANLWQGSSLQLATLAADLVNVDTGAVLHAGIGATRLWFDELPDGRVIYSNGVAMGIIAADGASRTAWGVPVPAGVGAAADVAGDLPPGEYRWCVTHRRDADGLEGGPAYSGRMQIAAGGLTLTGLPVLAGHATRVYVTTANGTEHYLAGVAAGGNFTLATAASRTIKCMTHYCKAPIAGSLMPRFWRGRMLVAIGDVLYASKARTLHLFSVREDFRRMAGTITMIEPVESGIWIGTTAGLFFMGPGTRFDQLPLALRAPGAVVLGSGVPIPGEHLMRGPSSAGKGKDGALCIAGRYLTACYSDGACVPLTQGRYQVDAQVTQVAATFRENGLASQYIAIPL